MRGLYTELEELADRLKLGRSGPEEAIAMLVRAEDRIELLRERSARGPRFAAAIEDELHEIEAQSKRVKAAMLIRPDAPYICIFRRPDRQVVAEGSNGDPITARLPFLCVLHAGDVDWLCRDGRMRVRDIWELLIDGVPAKPPIIGPRRWVMKNAQGAALMNAAGAGPWWMTRATALERRRALFKTERHNRRLGRRTRKQRKRSRLAMKRVGAVIADQILKRVFRDPVDYSRLLRKVPLASTPTSTSR